MGKRGPKPGTNKGHAPYQPHMMPDGVTRAVDVAQRNGVSANTFRQRVHQGWPIARAAMTPPIDRADRIRIYSHSKGQNPKQSQHRLNAAKRRAHGFRLVARVPGHRNPFGTDQPRVDPFASERIKRDLAELI